MRGEPTTVVAGTITSDLIEFFGNLGFDDLWLEAECGPAHYGDIGDLSRSTAQAAPHGPTAYDRLVTEFDFQVDEAAVR